MRMNIGHKAASLLLAGTLLLNAGEGLLEFPARAADDTYNDSIMLTADMPRGQQTAATILRGQELALFAEMQDASIDIANVAVNNAGKPLNITKKGTNEEIHNEYFYSVPANLDVSKPLLRPLTNWELDELGLDMGKLPIGNYGVMTSYQTYATTAASVIGSELAAGTAGFITLPNIDQRLLIGADSSFTLTFEYVEDATKNGFTVEFQGVDGTFTQWKHGLVSAEHQLASADNSTKETFTITVLDNQNIPYKFEFNPNYVYYTETIGSSGEVTRVPHFNLDPAKKGKYVYTINYIYARTRPEFNLNVLDPRVELERLVENATNTNILSKPNPNGGNTYNNHVLLTAEGDTSEYVTDDLLVAQKFEISDQGVKLDWSWEADDPAYADVVQLPNEPIVVDGRTYIRANIADRPADDVTGNLVVTAAYDDKRILQRDVLYGGRDPVVGRLPITIHGIGTPASMIQYSEIVGGEAEKIFDSNHQEMPRDKKMDAYRNTSPRADKTKDPYLYKLQINTGLGNGVTKQMIIDCLDEGAPAEDLSVTVTDRGETTEYTFGQTLDITSGANSIVTVTFTATRELNEGFSSFPLKFRFFVDGPNGTTREIKEAERSLTLNVYNTSPNTNADLKSLIINDNKREPIEYGFSKDKMEYNISVPYIVDKVYVKPTREDPMADEMIRVDWSSYDRPTIGASVPSGGSSPPIDLVANAPVTVEVRVTAEDRTTQKTYLLHIMREPPGDDATLKDLKVLDRDEENYVNGFTPDVREYKLEVPFRADKVQILAVPNDPNIQEIIYEPELRRDTIFGERNWLTLNKPEEPPTELVITVIPENGLEYDKKVYKLEITRLPPGENAYLSDLAVSDSEDQAQTYTPAFHKEMEAGEYYELEIPYSMKKLKFTATPEDVNATVELMHDRKVLQELGPGAPSKAFEVDYMDNNADFYEFTVRVTAENGSNQTDYPLHVMRAPPSDDNTLSALVVTQEDGAAAEMTPAFVSETLNYSVTVPYETDKVSVTATLGFADASLTIYGKKAVSGTPSSMIDIKYPGTTTVKVVVTAQNGRNTRTYMLRIRREKPSSDARLKSLAITGIEDTYKPIFVPDTLQYTATVAVGQEGVIITAIPNHPLATLKIDGKTVKNGEASELIQMMKVKQKIRIEVTAQDGKTTRTYTITFTDKNKIELTDNADLRSLVVKPGVMAPKFTPSATAYDVAVKEDVSSVQIIPKPDDDLAKVQVFFGTKEIGDWDGNYAQTIVDGANGFRVTVTSPSGKVTKDYTIMVYRNEEDQMQTLAPVTADDINFDQTGEVVLVDITKYTRVAADVFNTMREEYPEKTIVFEGNDYSLEFKGSDLDTIVPHTQVFDFALSFTSPEQTDILNITDRYPENNDARMVFIYFDHHGALPAQATFTVSLGHKYGSDTLFWHYYNPERDRIDFYGNVKTNTKGTFAVKLDHLSTYIASDQRLYGSENKAPNSAAPDNAEAGGDLSASASSKKINPGTGAHGRREPDAGEEGANAP